MLNCFSLAWETHPDKMDVLMQPIMKVAVPTVTLCQKDSNSERWGPMIKIFDHLKLSCPPERYISQFTNFVYKNGH